MIEAVFLRFSGGNPVILGLMGGGVIALLNGFGAVLVPMYRNPAERAFDRALASPPA